MRTASITGDIIITDNGKTYAAGNVTVNGFGAGKIIGFEDGLIVSGLTFAPTMNNNIVTFTAANISDKNTGGYLFDIYDGKTFNGNAKIGSLKFGYNGAAFYAVNSAKDFAQISGDGRFKLSADLTLSNEILRTSRARFRAADISSTTATIIEASASKAHNFGDVTYYESGATFDLTISDANIAANDNEFTITDSDLTAANFYHAVAPPAGYVIDGNLDTYNSKYCGSVTFKTKADYTDGATIEAVSGEISFNASTSTFGSPGSGNKFKVGDTEYIVGDDCILQSGKVWLNPEKH